MHYLRAHFMKKGHFMCLCHLCSFQIFSFSKSPSSVLGSSTQMCQNMPQHEGFPNSGKGWRGLPPPHWGGGAGGREDWKFYWKRSLLPGDGNLRRSDFYDLNLF